MFQVAGPQAWLNYSSSLCYISSRTVLQSGYFRPASQLQRGTGHDQERLVVSQEVRPPQGGAAQPTSALAIDLRWGGVGCRYCDWKRVKHN